MAASQVVVYFENQQDALLFTLAASSMLAADPTARHGEAAVKVAKEISKASRIRAEGTLNTNEPGK
jgi:hypothetical protein